MRSPKLLVHVFIGSRLALLAEEGDKMSTRDRIVNLTSMAIGGAVGLAVGWLIYRRTMRRAAEIAAEDALEAGLAIDGAAHSADGDDEGYADWDDETSQRRPLMVDPDAAALALDDDDGLALWGTDSNGQVGGYMDNFDAGDGDVNDGGAKRGTMNGKKSNGTV